MGFGVCLVVFGVGLFGGVWCLAAWGLGGVVWLLRVLVC